MNDFKLIKNRFHFQSCFEVPQSVGVVGGRPNSAFYFIGYQDSKLLYLDPHVTQDSIGPDSIDLEKYVIFIFQGTFQGIVVLQPMADKAIII